MHSRVWWSDSQTPQIFSLLEKRETKLKSDSRDVCVGGSPGKSHTINPTTFDRLPKAKIPLGSVSSCL